MELGSDTLIFIFVIIARLGLPLLILRYPLPAIIICLILDGIDQSIFQRFTTLDLSGYQSYDKALDIYYLSIAYISTLRNWTNLFAFRASKFLLYYRLIGVTLFEFTGLRALLLIFPNTFEYFFIFYHSVALRWKPTKYTNKMIVGSIILIWGLIKLPQEYWIHIAKLDVTEALNKHLFNMPADTPIIKSFLDNPLITLALMALLIALILGSKWYVVHKLPPSNHKFTFVFKSPNIQNAKKITDSMPKVSFFHGPLFEKIILVGLISTIFSMMLPGVKGSVLGFFLFISVVIALNSAVSHWLSKRKNIVAYKGIAREFFSMLSINALIVFFLFLIMPSLGGSINWEITSFFLFLITIFITLYDSYFPVHQFLFSKTEQKKINQ